MELRQLRAFVEVAGQGHFGRAAQRLHLTQPSLTQRIQALERDVGVQLLERNAREVRLTAAGTTLLPYAQNLIDAEDRALRDLKDYASGITGRLRIAYQVVGDVSIAASIIAEFQLRYPEVGVETSSASSGPNIQRLLERSTDAAFVLMPQARPPSVAARTIRRDEVVLAMRSDHPLAHLARIPVRSLRGQALVLPPASASPDSVGAFEHWLVRHTGAELNVVAERPVDLAIESIARSGTPPTVLLRRYVPSVPGLVYRSLKPAPYIDLVVAYLKDDQSPTLANFLRVVEDLAPFDASETPEDGELI